MKDIIYYFCMNPALTWEKDEKYEYELYYSWINENSFGQLKFDLTFESIEEFFKALGYFTEKGWFNKIKLSSSILPYRNARDPWLSTVWVTNEYKQRRKREKPIDDIGELDRSAILDIEIIVDLKRLEEFRRLIKEMPSFKTTWWINNKIQIV